MHTHTRTFFVHFRRIARARRISGVGGRRYTLMWSNYAINDVSQHIISPNRPISQVHKFVSPSQLFERESLLRSVARTRHVFRTSKIRFFQGLSRSSRRFEEERREREMADPAQYEGLDEATLKDMVSSAS